MSKKRKHKQGKKTHHTQEQLTQNKKEISIENNFSQSSRIDKILKNSREMKDKFLLRGSSFGEQLSLKSKKYYQKISVILKRWNNIFCTGMTCQTNLKRDIIIISLAIGVALIFLIFGQYANSLGKKVANRNDATVSEANINEDAALQFEIDSTQQIKNIQENISIENWKEYKSAWYGFKIKYPENWKFPVVKAINRNSKEKFRVSFVANNLTDSSYAGFDVAVYEINSIKELSNTSEFPLLKNQADINQETCRAIEGHVIETGDYPAEEVYIAPMDECYDPTLFFTITSGAYIYNIAPILKTGIEFEGDPMVEVSDTLPEFFGAISQFENIEIVRPKPVLAKPRINAPKPASYKVDQFGRLVCEKKNDKPGKSDKGKGKHLDMECCLDPDEYPNPHCYYDSSKYGKYLK